MDFTLCLTHDCNQRCTYCYAGRKSKKRMPWRTAERAIDFAVEQTLQRLPPHRIQFGFFGGEPMLEWDMIPRVTAYVEERARGSSIGLKKTLTTNATLLERQHADYLAKHDFYVGLSMDGNRRMHDRTRRFRNGRSSHARCWRALQLYKGPDARAEVIVTVDPENVKSLGESVRWLSDGDICNISLNPNFYTEWSDSARALWRRGYEEAAEVYIENFRRPRYFRINFIDGKIRTRVEQGYRPCDRCSFGEEEIAVAPSGNIYPCERLVGEDNNPEMCIGNVFDGFDDTKRMALLKKRGGSNPECRECVLRERCMNWCGCINYATTGETDKVHEVVCFHEQLTIEVADRAAATLYDESNPYFLAKFYEQAEQTS